MEGTISPAVRTMGVRRSRSRGPEKTHRQHIATATALPIVRRLAWFAGLPRAQTRRSALTRLSEAASEGSPAVSGSLLRNMVDDRAEEMLSATHIPQFGKAFFHYECMYCLFYKKSRSQKCEYREHKFFIYALSFL